MSASRLNRLSFGLSPTSNLHDIKDKSFADIAENWRSRVGTNDINVLAADSQYADDEGLFYSRIGSARDLIVSLFHSSFLNLTLIASNHTSSDMSPADFPRTEEGAHSPLSWSFVLNFS